MDKYVISWVETSHMQATVSALELANMLGCEEFDLDTVADLTQGLDDALAEVEEDPDVTHFTRENIEVTKIHRGKVTKVHRGEGSSC